MDSPTALLRASTLIFLIGLALIVVYRALTGRLQLRGLLSEMAAGGVPGDFSRARAQLLVIASLSALAFLSGRAPAEAQISTLRVLVPIALTLSNLIYLRSKIRALGFPLRLFRRRRTQ